MAQFNVSFAVERLRDLLIDEAKSLCGVSGEVEEIQVELKRMQCFLKDADARQDGDKRVRNWVAEIRKLACKTADVLEIYVVKVASNRIKDNENFLRRFARVCNEGIALLTVGWEIRTIKAQIADLTRSLHTYGIKSFTEGEISNSVFEKQRLLRQSYPHLIEKDFVGMEEDIKQLVSLLVNEGKHDGIISICGMGGQGKTTLAMQIYSHKDVRSYFEGFAWACATQKCQAKTILQQLLKELLPERRGEITMMESSELIQKLHRVQQQKKCLVVLDDIWLMDDWKIIRAAFPIRDTAGSKVLLTTRNRKVAEVGCLHELTWLNEDEGWELLQRKAFPRRDEAPNFKVGPEMEKLGREMVRQCGSLPLAITVLGGLLKGKNTSKDWKMVNNDIDSYLRRGEGIEKDHGAVSKVLALSYDDLPFQLKPCFLYLGNFLEDSEIEAEKLYLLWMAEGLVSLDDQGEGETMMDVAERYLGELAHRSMVQVKLADETLPLQSSCRYEFCGLHDLMRDVCLSKGKKEDFLKVIDFGSHGNELAAYSSPWNSQTRTNRLTIYLHRRDSNRYALPDHETTQCLRSLLFLDVYDSYGTLRWPKRISNLNDFKLIRVLALEGFDFTKRELPQGIGELIYLRYLSFRRCGLEELPSSIFKLRNLQTLDLCVVAGPHCKLCIPNMLWKMERLRHLYFPAYICTQKDQKLRLDGLNELERLEFDPSVCNVKDLVEFTHLRVLEVTNIGNLEDLVAVINHVNFISNHLRHLTFRIDNSCNFYLEEGPALLGQLLGCERLDHLVMLCRIGKLPDLNDHHFKFSPSLTRLSLTDSQLEEDPMATLEKLPNLRNLELRFNAFRGKEMVCSAMGFPQLKSLTLSYLSNLEKWTVDEGAIPNLSLLCINCCGKLKMLPDGLRFVTELRELKISYMPEAFTNRVQCVDDAGGEDFHKVRHVPTITLKR